MLEKYNILRNAEKHVINRNLSQAIREYERIVEQETEDPSILNTLGDLLLKDGRRDDALARFRRVAEIYGQSGFLSKAIAICKKIHHLDPRDNETNSRLIDLFSRQGLTSEAIRHLEGLVKQCQTWGQFDSALTYQEQILSLAPDRPDDHLMAARLLHQLDRMDDAQTHYLRAVHLFRSEDAISQSYEVAREALRLCGESPQIASRLVEVGQELAARLRKENSLEEAERLEQEVLELQEHTSQVIDQSVEDGNDNESEMDSVSETPEKLEIDSTSDVRGYDLLVDQPADELKSQQEQENDLRPSFADYLFGSDSKDEPPEPPQREVQELEGRFTFDELNSSPDSESRNGPGALADENAEAGAEADATVEALTVEDSTEQGSVAQQEDEVEWDGSLEEALQEADFYLKLGLKDDARSLVEKLIRRFPSDERVRQRAIKASVEVPEAPVESAETPKPVETADSTDNFGVEVESALDDLFSSEMEPEPAEILRYDVTSAGGNSKDDPRVHYDLGMAYKEMGLLEDAIEKFQDAYRLFNGQNSAAQRILCCSMLSTAYNQLKNFEQAVKWSEEGLSLPDKKDFEWKALQYDRCYAFEELGEIDWALEGYATILDRDPDYRDVSQRVEVLTVQVNGQ